MNIKITQKTRDFNCYRTGTLLSRLRYKELVIRKISYEEENEFIIRVKNKTGSADVEQLTSKKKRPRVKKLRLKNILLVNELLVFKKCSD